MDSTLELFDKQSEFFHSDNRINIYIGGIQSGKTTCGALKMVLKGVLNHVDSEDNFIICADTYKTLSQATLPKFLSFAKQYGRLNRQSGEFKTVYGSTVYCRTSTEPESMEGITNVRRIWIDEAGKVSRYFFENCMGRAAFKTAPIDITTTPYSMNWLSEVYKHFREGKRNDVFATQCRSIDSPYFPKEEYERQRGLLDPHRFKMKYEGHFGVMEGLVFPQINLCKSFGMPAGTKYYAGMDWGFRDPFCLVVRALTPEGRHYRVAEYYRSHLTIAEIIDVARSFNAIYHFEMCYCDPSQPAHIEELNRQGIKAVGAINDIRPGLDAHYQLIKEERFFIFEDMNPLGIDEYRQYHYPEERDLKIDETRSAKYELPVDQFSHGIDSDRYITMGTRVYDGERLVPKVPIDQTKAPLDIAKRIAWLKQRKNREYIER